MKKAGNGPSDQSQNMGPKCGIFLEIFGLSVTVQKLLWAVVWNLCIKFYFGEYKTGNG